jgi:hypothetical protein
MKKLWLVLIVLVSCAKDNKKETLDFTTKFESSKGFETATYSEAIAYYKTLSKVFKQISIDSLGTTDAGEPLHYVIFDPSASGKSINTLREEKNVLLINNGIHPGESDGIDATMMLYRDLAQGQINTPKNTVVVTIPIYNIGGSLNRNSGTRTNQNGPSSYGFRGNAQNYDLNRDFIKADTKNAQSFARLFHMVQPDVFIDNHVSNGADYQYTLTHLFTQHNKLGGPQGDYLQKTLMPRIESTLNDKNWDITPYVNVFNRTPESGFSQFMDHPRYSTGYTSLFHSLGMMVETHMLKPYKIRVEGTYEIMKTVIEIMEENPAAIKSIKNKQTNYWMNAQHYPTQWEIDSTKITRLNFKGYEAEFIESDLTGAKRLKYDPSKPFVKPIKYFNYFKPTDSIAIPEAYIIPKGWYKVIERLKENNIEMISLEKDTILKVRQYKIEDYNSRRTPYEGHFPHYNTKVSESEVELRFFKGDYYVSTKQFGIRYLLETLEPTAIDSFFNWNYFDTILQQKEGFSPYVWEDKAKELLRQNPQLSIDFNLKKTFDKDFANNWYAQLDWLHKQSDHYEKAHMTYPVYKVFK